MEKDNLCRIIHNHCGCKCLILDNPSSTQKIYCRAVECIYTIGQIETLHIHNPEVMKKVIKNE
jgi:hypothetical protein